MSVTALCYTMTTLAQISMALCNFVVFRCVNNDVAFNLISILCNESDSPDRMLATALILSRPEGQNLREKPCWSGF